MSKIRWMEWNRFEVYVGLPNCGKTTVMREQILILLSMGVLVFFVDQDVPMEGDTDGVYILTGSGARVPWHRMRSLTDYRAGVMNVTGADPSEVLDMAKRAALASREMGPDGKPRATPVAVFVDEVVDWSEADPDRKSPGPTLRNMMAKRRHHHVSLHVGTQFTRLCHPQLFTAASTLWLFRQEDASDLARLKRGALPDAVLAALPDLPEYTYLEFRRRERRTLVHRP